MYIKASKDSLHSIRTPEMEEMARFSDNNIAQVSKEDGEALLEENPDVFEEHNEDN